MREIVWGQEEPENMGAWHYVAPWLRDLFGARVPVRYVGRSMRASTAEGSLERHAAEQQRILDEAFATSLQVFRCSGVEMEEVGR